MRWTTQERGGAARLSHELAAGAVRVLRVGGAGGTRPTGRRHRRLRLRRVARRCRRLLPHRHAEAHQGVSILKSSFTSGSEPW